MNIHEYQAKELLKQYNITCPNGVLITNIGEVKTACDSIEGDSYVLKAQIHAGGRGKSGGIIMCNGVDEVITASNKLLHSQLITKQTSSNGLKINSVLLEQTQDIALALYLSIVIDRDSKSITIITSKYGGMDIEQVASDSPDSIIKTHINNCIGIREYQIRDIAFALDITSNNLQEFTNLVKNIYQIFIEKDLSLLEINPLIITKNNNIIALDAKIDCEDNALYRQQQIALLKDSSQENHYEHLAKKHQLSYIALNGNIGCMVNGAGLAMATMDLISYYGGKPANFLDVGGGTTEDRVAKALEIIINSGNIKAILVNIFGGIVRCDLIAKGIIKAVEELNINIAIVVRLIGTNAKQAQEILQSSTIKVYPENDLSLATKKAVELAQ